MNAEQDIDSQGNAVAENPPETEPRPGDKPGMRAVAIAGLFLLVAAIVAAAAFLLPREKDRDAASPPPATENPSGLKLLGSATQHPLDPALALAEKVKKNIEENVRDYTATVYKQERYNGELRPIEVCNVKIRSRPFSVYMGFVAPPDLKGQEAIYVEGSNDGKLMGHAGSGFAALAGMKSFAPTHPIVMFRQRYPITELGIENLVRRLIEVGNKDREYRECYVWQNDNARVGDRPCISFTVMHPEKRHSFIFHIARIFVDKELLVPLHYEAYDWPTTPGGEPLLLERYTYADLKLNVDLTDADFDPANPEYNFGMK